MRFMLLRNRELLGPFDEKSVDLFSTLIPITPTYYLNSAELRKHHIDESETCLAKQANPQIRPNGVHYKDVLICLALEGHHHYPFICWWLILPIQNGAKKTGK